MTGSINFKAGFSIRAWAFFLKDFLPIFTVYTVFLGNGWLYIYVGYRTYDLVLTHHI